MDLDSLLSPPFFGLPYPHFVQVVASQSVCVGHSLQAHAGGITTLVLPPPSPRPRLMPSVAVLGLAARSSSQQLSPAAGRSRRLPVTHAARWLLLAARGR